MRRLRNSFLALSAAAAAGSLTLLVIPAGATPTTDAPVSGDARATAYAGNIKDGDCAAAGLPGSKVEVTYTIDASGTHVTITDVPQGTTLTGVVVKGGAAYNVYPGDYRTDLHAPLVSSGKPAQISHWFACGITVSTTTPGPTPTTPGPTPTTPGPTPTTPGPTPTTPGPTPTTPSVSPTTPSTSPTSPGGSIVPPPTSPPTSPGAGPVVPPTGPVPPSSGGLPMTGSSTAAVVGLGLALLLAGLALLLSPVSRRRLLGR